ncbi:threonine ammonia-lyase [Halothermothrix orenii]|uniref:L-threonine dehydratase catabolic TdcB n=1 Tax=Halothermothrix orenii (strain H 168 / OCM 544 / DSM 9562) TaxID=373903 RepID=B8CWL8_HALOH|nr:threonine ammonia-lyase [Halothermothrix orenii]ACL69687.1 threonine dehydratase [Halothermothrix orenii H 168]
MEITLEDVKKASERLKGVIHRTNLIYSYTFSKLTGNKVYMKPENFQKTGSFKIRGAFNKIACLSDEEKRHGVIASSAGNHAQGVAFGASQNGIKSTIVMPKRAPMAKVTATKNYGAKVVLYGNNYDEAYEKAKEIQEETKATFVHPFNDPYVIAGQGTLALEIIEELPDADIIVTPVGGGGLISGIALAAKALNPSIKIVGVEACQAASMANSLNKGKLATLTEVNTIADGICVKTPGDLTFNICREYVDDVVAVSEEEIANAILMLMERAKMVVEGAGATSIAALIYKKLGVQNKKIVPVLSGGNIDFNIISRIIERGLAKAGRKTIIKTYLEDRPGSLQKLLSLIAELDSNIISINHNHYNPDISIDKAEVELELETKHRDHVNDIIKKLKENNYKVIRLL